MRIDGSRRYPVAAVEVRPLDSAVGEQLEAVDNASLDALAAGHRPNVGAADPVNAGPRVAPEGAATGQDGAERDRQETSHMVLDADRGRKVRAARSGSR